MSELYDYTYPVVEWVETIQGELPNMGKPCVLIRLKHCNLNCTYCDAQTTMNREPNIMTIGDILDQLGTTPIREVLLTGGEPLTYRILPLLRILQEKGYTCVLETNGTMKIAGLPYRTRIAMDVKFTDEALDYQNVTIQNLKMLSRKDIVKFVVGSLDDAQQAVEFILRHEPKHAGFLWVFSNISGTVLPIQFIVDGFKSAHLDLDRLRFQTQLHKIWEVA